MNLFVRWKAFFFNAFLKFMVLLEDFKNGTSDSNWESPRHEQKGSKVKTGSHSIWIHLVIWVCFLKN